VLPVLSGLNFPFGPRIATAFTLLLTLLTLVGCGTVVDKVKLQDTVQASLEDSIREKIKKVECPSDQSVDPGATFTCDVIFSDDRREVAILKIRNEEADITMIDLKPKN
jgi:chromosome condensin MukBEF MukE localization factor